MDIPDYIKTEWKGRGFMIIKVADSECKTCLKNWEGNEINEFNTVECNATVKENASENVERSTTSKINISKKSSPEEGSRCETIKTTETNEEKYTKCQEILNCPCPHTKNVQCYLSTLNVWEYEIIKDDIDYKYLESQIPPTITTEIWESWLKYWDIWRSTYVDLGWVHRYPQYCKEDTKEWYNNYLTDEKMMFDLGYHDDIELHKEKYVSKHLTKSGESFEKLLDELYAEHSFIRYWAHFRLYLRDYGLVELNDELAEYIKYFGVTQGPLDNSDSNTGANIQLSPGSEDANCPNKSDSLTSHEADDELSKSDSGVITSTSEDCISRITQSEENCKSNEGDKTPEADVLELEVHSDVDVDAVSSGKSIAGTEELESKLLVSDKLEAELSETESTPFDSCEEYGTSDSLDKNIAMASSCEASLIEQRILKEDIESTEKILHDNTEDIESTEKILHDNTEDIESTEKILHDNTEDIDSTEKILHDNTEHSNSPSVSTDAGNVESCPVQVKKKLRGGSKKKYSTTYQRGTAWSLQLIQQGMHSGSSVFGTEFILKNNAKDLVTMNVECGDPTTLENLVNEITIPSEWSVNGIVLTSAHPPSELTSRIENQLAEPTVTPKTTQRIQTKRKYDEMEDDAMPSSAKKSSAQDVPHPTSRSKFQRIFSAINYTFRSIWSLGALYSKAAMNLVLFVLRINPYTPGHAQFLTFTPHWWPGQYSITEKSLIEKQMRTAEKTSVNEVWRFFSAALRHITFYPPLTSVDTQFYVKVNRLEEEREPHYNLVKIIKNINEESKSYKGLSVRYLTDEELDYELENLDTDFDYLNDEVPSRTNTPSTEDGHAEESSSNTGASSGGGSQEISNTGAPSGDPQEDGNAQAPNRTETLTDDGKENTRDFQENNWTKFKQMSIKTKIRYAVQNCRMMQFPIMEDCNDTENKPPEEIPESVRKYWNQRYRIFLKYDDGIKLDEESWYSVTPELVAEHQASRCSCDVVIDGFCGAGGNAIQLAGTCNKVIAIDIDPAKIELAKHNAKIYGVEDDIEFIVGDFFEVAPKIKADVVFLSPPWGGIDYKKEKVFDIFKFGGVIDGKRLFEVAAKITPNVAIYLPKHTKILQVIELAGCGGQVDIEFDHIGNKRKSLTAYYGKLATKPLSGNTFLN